MEKNNPLNFEEIVHQETKKVFNFLLIKPVSYRCNLRCKYCFYSKTSQLYENPLVMPPEVLETLIRKAMNHADGAPCAFSWQGGEPLLAGLPRFTGPLWNFK